MMTPLAAWTFFVAKILKWENPDLVTASVTGRVAGSPDLSRDPSRFFVLL